MASDHNPTEAIRVLVCDDHAPFRRGLMLVLELAGITVVGEAVDGIEAVALALELAPDVVLMDLHMPRRDGAAATRALATALPATRIVLLTSGEDDDELYPAVKAGACGALRKDVVVEEVADAVRAVVAGHSLVSPALAARLLLELGDAEPGAEGRPAEVRSPQLTGREAQVLRLVATGRTDRDIAGELAIAGSTVRNHVRNILQKLHLHSRVEAAMFAVRENLIDLT